MYPYWLYPFTRGLRPVLRLIWRFRVEGEASAMPRRGPMIVAANHSSFLDPWFVCVMLPQNVRFVVTRQWFYKSPFWEWFLTTYGCIPVHADGGEATTRAAAPR